MKALTEEDNKKKSIIYANKDDLIKKINILNKINNNHPELTCKLGTPMYLTSELPNAYYSISEVGLIDENGDCTMPYDQYFDDIAEVAYHRVLAKLIISKITEESKKKIVLDLISLDNINFNNKLTESSFNGIQFQNIKELLNQYQDLVDQALTVSLNDEEKEKEVLEEFIKSLKYLNNIVHNRHRTTNSNIAIEIK